MRFAALFLAVLIAGCSDTKCATAPTPQHDPEFVSRDHAYHKRDYLHTGRNCFYYNDVMGELNNLRQVNDADWDYETRVVGEYEAAYDACAARGRNP